MHSLSRTVGLGKVPPKRRGHLVPAMVAVSQGACLLPDLESGSPGRRRG